MVASSTSRTSCGASGLRRPSTRRIFDSSSIRCDLVLEAPGGVDDQHVDAGRGGLLDAVEDDAGRVAAFLAGDDRRADALAPDLAAARWRRRGRCRRRRAGRRNPAPSASGPSLPIVVVLPEPLTPITRITCGRGKPHTCSGLATGVRIFSISSARIDAKAAFVEALELLAGDGFADAMRRFGTEIRRDQRFFDVVERRRVERRAAGQAGEIVARPCPQSSRTRHAGGRANSCPHRRQVIAVAAGDARGAGVAARGAFDRDRRKTVAVALAVVLDEHLLCRADEAVEPARPALERRPARSRAARAFTTSRASCGMRAAGVFGPRREGKDVRGDDVAIVKQFQSCSVPFPRFRSESRRSGRRRWSHRAATALMRSTVRTASARLWRRFIRFRIMSSPACSERWKCGISRGSPAISSNKASSISMLSSEERRRRVEARIGGEQPLAQLAEASRRDRSRDVDAGEDDLLRARDRVRARPPRGWPRTAATGSARAPARSSRRCSDGRSRSGPRRSCAHGPGSRRSDCDVLTASDRQATDLVRRFRRRDRLPAWPRTPAGSSSAAQPVTRIRASGRWRCARRIAWRVWRTASLVTAQLLTTIQSSSVGAERAIVSLSAKFSRQPSVIVSTLIASASRSISPSKTWVALPRMRIGSPGAQAMVSDAAASCRLSQAIARAWSAIAATAVAQAPVPQASVIAGAAFPGPQVGCRRGVPRDVDVDPLGKGRVVLDPRPELVEVDTVAHRRRRRRRADCRR